MSAGYRYFSMCLGCLTALFIFLFGLTAMAAPPERLKNIGESYSAFQQGMPEDRVYLMLDKSFYFPGETIWFSAFVRNGADMAPSVKSEILHVEWVAPSGNVEKELTLITRKGAGAGDITLAPDAPGGLYTLRAYTQWQKNSPEPLFFEKKIPVQHVVVPRLKMRLDFLRESYGGGDEVQVSFDARGRDDSPLGDHEFSYTLMLAGKKISENKSKTDKEGKALIRFSLPDPLGTADGLLRVKLDYEANPESISRSVPLLSSKLQLGIYPEGGDLVTGLTSKVAFLALDEWGKPADIRARIETQEGETVTECDTLHQGMGLFKLRPAPNAHYRLRVLKPEGIDTLYPLPKALSRGYILAVEQKPKNTLDILVDSTEKETLTLAVRGRNSAAQFLTLNAVKGENKTSVSTADFSMGVCQITLFDGRGIERAERLVFVHASKTLAITTVTDKDVYLPREKVTMLIGVADERGMPVPSQLALTVTDDRLLAFADDKDGRIYANLLLLPDLKGTVYEPSYYFDRQNKDRLKALDLVMLTHGWRRFTWKTILSKDKPALSFAGEMAEIKGFVYMDHRKRTPVANAMVTIASTGKTVIADDTGAFVIRDLDLYEIETLTAKDGNGREGSVTVRDYNETPVIYLTPPIRYKGARNFLGLGRPEAIPEPMEEGADIVLEAGMPPEVMMDEEPAMAAAQEEPAPAMEEPMKEIMDPGFGKALIRPEENRKVKAQPIYYRVREFPSPVYQTTETDMRNDFRSTLYFNGTIETDRRGMAQIEFNNSDAISSFRAIVEGIGAGGLVGRGESVHVTRLPFSIDAKAPVSVAMGDRMDIPLTVTNTTDEPIKGRLKITVPSALKALSGIDEDLVLNSHSSRVLPVSFEVLDQPGVFALGAEFSRGNDKDAFQTDIRVVPKGFPIKMAFSGQSEDKTYKASIHKPVEGSIAAKFTAYPTLLSDLLAGIQSILQEPYGCFEQASSSTYPNIMVLDYLKKQDRPDPKIAKKALDLIARGYNKLTAYETEQKGYEWFGHTPGHEALTAYGLMEFKDMQKVYPQVDETMVKRTAQWLLDRRDGQGGFLRSDQALDSFGRADADITNAYIVYALSEAGFVVEIQKELDKACDAALASDDPYILALVANALFNVKDKRNVEVLAKLMPHQSDNGSFTGKKQSITCSTGEALSVETTALAVMAMIKSGQPEMAPLDKAVRFIVASRKSYGGFGNTQSTVLALKALTSYSLFARQTAEAGRIEIQINGKPVAEKAYDKGEKGEIFIGGDILTPVFEEGDFTIRVTCPEVKNPLPYTFALTYNTLIPPGSGDCDLSLETTLAEKTVKMGDTVRMSIAFSNIKKNQGLPMSVAVIGIPGGLSLQPWQLKELQEKNQVDYVEVLNSDLVLYYRQMKPAETRTLDLDLKAEIPGEYEAAASCAYLYYTSEHKTWVKGERVKIK